MAIKQFRNWFFQPTGTPGTRFLKNNKPTESVFRDFLESIGFIKEVNNTASDVQQGFVKKPTNAHIASRSAADSSGFALGVTPAQLPKVTLNGAPVTPTQDSTGTQTYNVVTSTSTTTVSQNGDPIIPVGSNYDVEVPSVSVNGTAVPLVANNYNVNTILESVEYNKNPVNTLAINNSTSFDLANSTIVSNAMTLTSQYNTLTGSAFSYDSVTGIFTINKAGWYNLECRIHFGENVAADYWIDYKDGTFYCGHFMSAIFIPSGTGMGNQYVADNCVFYTSILSGDPVAPPYNKQKYVDMYLSRRNVYISNGSTLQLKIQNNTVAINPGTGETSGGLINLSMQLIALD